MPGGATDAQGGGRPAMAGKTCVVTGATSGIGRVTARELAARGARVLVVGRSRERCEAAVAQIRESTGNREVEYLRADLANQAEIRRLAAEIRDLCPRLDVLVNNAGTIVTAPERSSDGLELTFAVNHLGYFLLTNLLVDLLKHSAPSRIVNVASEAHRLARSVDFDALRPGSGPPTRHDGLRAYAQSKLANLLFTRELARRLEGTGVVVNALHPGFVATNIFAGNGLLGWFSRQSAALFALSPEAGARTSVYLAADPDAGTVTGGYYAKCRAVTPSAPARDAEAAARLWAISEELTGLSAARPA